MEYLALGLAVPLITTGIDFAVQKARNKTTPLLSKRYAKALGISAIGTGLSYAAIGASVYIYFKYYFSLNINFGF